jgi:formate dehydrogenase major subunit
VFEEMRQLMPSIAGLSWERLQREGAVTYPVADEHDPGQPVVFTDGYPTPTGRARLVPAELCGPRPSSPTSRLPAGADHRAPAGALAHRQHDPAALVLDAVEPGPVLSLHPDTAQRLGLAAGQAPA